MQPSKVTTIIQKQGQTKTTMAMKGATGGVVLRKPEGNTIIRGLRQHITRLTPLCIVLSIVLSIVVPVMGISTTEHLKKMEEQQVTTTVLPTIETPIVGHLHTLLTEGRVTPLEKQLLEKQWIEGRLTPLEKEEIYRRISSPLEKGLVEKLVLEKKLLEKQLLEGRLTPLEKMTLEKQLLEKQLLERTPFSNQQFGYSPFTTTPLYTSPLEREILERRTFSPLREVTQTPLFRSPREREIVENRMYNPIEKEMTPLFTSQADIMQKELEKNMIEKEMMGQMTGRYTTPFEISHMWGGMTSMEKELLQKQLLEGRITPFEKAEILRCTNWVEREMMQKQLLKKKLMEKKLLGEHLNQWEEHVLDKLLMQNEIQKRQFGYTPLTTETSGLNTPLEKRLG